LYFKAGYSGQISFNNQNKYVRLNKGLRFFLKLAYLICHISQKYDYVFIIESHKYKSQLYYNQQEKILKKKIIFLKFFVIILLLNIADIFV